MGKKKKAKKFLAYRHKSSVERSLSEKCIAVHIKLPQPSLGYRCWILRQVRKKAWEAALQLIPETNTKLRAWYEFQQNCRPAGFNTRPRTRACAKPNHCPWCFVRKRLLVIHDHLMQVSHGEFRLFAWKRGAPVVLDTTSFKIPSFKFSGTNSGPHQKFKAEMTIETVFLTKLSDGTLGWQPVVLLVVTKDKDVVQQLRKRSRMDATDIYSGPVTSTGIQDALAFLCKLDWLELFNTVPLNDLLRFTARTARDQGGTRAKFLRVKQRKGKKDGNGNRFATIRQGFSESDELEERALRASRLGEQTSGLGGNGSQPPEHATTWRQILEEVAGPGSVAITGTVLEPGSLGHVRINADAPKHP